MNDERKFIRFKKFTLNFNYKINFLLLMKKKKFFYFFYYLTKIKKNIKILKFILKIYIY